MSGRHHGGWRRRAGRLAPVHGLSYKHKYIHTYSHLHTYILSCNLNNCQHYKNGWHRFSANESNIFLLRIQALKLRIFLLLLAKYVYCEKRFCKTLTRHSLDLAAKKSTCIRVLWQFRLQKCFLNWLKSKISYWWKKIHNR